jgi:hypothetical protein
MGASCKPREVRDHAHHRSACTTVCL